MNKPPYEAVVVIGTLSCMAIFDMKRASVPSLRKFTLEYSTWNMCSGFATFMA